MRFLYFALLVFLLAGCGEDNRSDGDNNSSLTMTSHDNQNCSEEDRAYNEEVGAGDPEEAYQFSLKIQEAFKNRDLNALYELIDGDPVYGPRRSFALSKKFTDIFNDDIIEKVVSADPVCRPLSYKGFLMASGQVWFNRYDDGLWVFSLPLATQETLDIQEGVAWSIEGDTLSRECFQNVWPSLDNFEEYEEQFKIKNVQEFRRSPGEFFGSEVTSLSPIKASWGDDLALIKSVSSCKASDDSFVKDEYGYFPYRLVKYIEPGICTNLASNIGAICKESYFLETSDRGGYAAGIYGLFDLPDLGESIVPLRLFGTRNLGLNVIDELAIDYEDEMMSEILSATRVRQFERQPTAPTEVSWDWKLLPQVIESTRIADKLKVLKPSFEEKEVHRTERLDEGGYHGVIKEFYDEHGVVRIGTDLDASDHHYDLWTRYYNESGELVLLTGEGGSYAPYGLKEFRQFFDSSGSVVWTVELIENEYYNPDDDYPDIKDQDGSLCSVRMGVDVNDSTPLAAQFIVEHDDWIHEKSHCDWKEPK